MPERLHTIEWTAPTKEKVEQIGHRALALMEDRYGDGTLDSPGGIERKLPFHHLPHARMVGERAAALCARLELSPPEIGAARMAGFAHDVVQLRGVGTNEAESAEWLEEQLDVYKIPKLKSATSAAILGTEPIFQDGILTLQKAHEIEHPDAQVVKAVAAADLSQLYRPEGPLEGHQLFAEIKGNQSGEEVSLDGVTDFQRNQLALLDGYTYPLPEAEQIFATHRSQVIRYGETVLRATEQGVFDSFDELLESDRQFARSLEV